MRLGTVLFEARLTEGGFQTQDATLVKQYCCFEDVFDYGELPKTKGSYISYQFIRNVLAADALDLSFCLLVDARRPDPIEDWYRIVRCIRSAALRTRCRVHTCRSFGCAFLPACDVFWISNMELDLRVDRRSKR